jgi:hypothetical protein
MIHFKRIEGKGSHGWRDKRSRTGYRVFEDGREETCYQQRGDAVERLRKGADWNPWARPAHEKGTTDAPEP